MSHLGMRILYKIINDLPYASAERFFSPWVDLEEYMRRNNILLTSLETNTSLREFDVAGFSLQYELSYTTVLNMLRLGSIPLRSEERLNSKRRYPLVIAGGPCTVNPAPMSPFIDAFLIGDGEEAVVEIIDAIKKCKSSGDNKLQSILQEISKIEGVYVPSIHKPEFRIKRRFIASIDNAPYPLKPVVPYMSIIHDRINIEVSRGCTMGCRFCQAGMIYRPLRERCPETVLRIAEESFKNTGYDEISFTSLSAGDYTHLLPLAKEFNRRFGESRIALSLPSLRVASVNQDVLKEIRSIRKTGFTIAPEAATERLRNVINKDFNNDDYESALTALFKEGWLNLKLYFMIGLPTETDEDIQAINDMAFKALKIAKRNINRFVNISITVSPFVPKSHTPFQWHGQIPIDETRKKLQYLKKTINNKKFKYKGHNEEMSLLEAVFARGDEKLSVLIEKAWELGCRLDGWSDIFDFSKWIEAMGKTGIDGPFYAERYIKKDEVLPWDNIDIGVKKDFLCREYENAMKGEKTLDCRKVCNACGLECQKDRDGLCMTGITDRRSRTTHHNEKVRVRAQFSKTGIMRCLSHLEVVSVILRGMRRAKMPLDFSQGFSPKPLISFGPSLSVGVAGEKEYFDMEVFIPFDVKFYMDVLNNTLPEGIRIQKMAIIPKNEPSLSSFIKRYEYEITGLTIQDIEKEKFPAHPVVVKRDGKSVDISSCIEDVKTIEFGNGLKAGLILNDQDTIKVRIGEITEAMLGKNAEELTITRTALYGWKEGWVEPL
jgi:radical SAM family uncharacterized protein/radical SAM-linked protein